MKITKVDTLPPKRSHKKNLQGALDEFMSSNAKIVKIEYAEGEYATPISCYGSLHKAIKHSGYGIRVKMINGEIYLIKKNIV